MVLDLLHFIEGKADVGYAALNLRQSAHIELADLRHHGWIGRQVMLDAHHDVAAGSKHVCQERVFGEFDGVAVVEDRDRQHDHAGIGLHFLVAPHCDVDRDRPVVARRVVERQRLVVNRPFAGGEITNNHQRRKRKQNCNTTLHVRPRRPASGNFRCSRLCGLVVHNICHDDVTGRLNIVTCPPYHCAAHPLIVQMHT